MRRPPGYLLVLEPGELDLDCFEELLRAAREAAGGGDPAAAASALRVALALWRGPALGDVLYEPFAVAEAEGLEERRLVALEERFDADLSAGGGAELVPELEALVRKHPLRERLLGQLMVALYRAGRQADALTALQTARHRLTDELGLEPGPQLRELERRVLQQDPRLEGERKSGRARKQVLVRALGAVAAVVVTVGTVGGILATRGGHSPRLGAEQTNRLLAISVSSGSVTHAVELPDPPAGLAAGFGSVWVADPGEQSIVRVDPASGSVTDRIPVGGQPGSLTTGGGAVWVASTLGGRISRVDPKTDAVTQTIRLGGTNVAGIAFGERAVWVADSPDHALIEIEPESGSVRRTLTLDLVPTALAVGEGVIWVAGYESRLVEEIDSRSGEVIATVAVGQGPSAVTVGRDGVWVANSLDATVSRVDPNTGSVLVTIPVPSGPAAISATRDSVWVASADAGVVSQIDLRRNVIVASRQVGGRPEALAPAGDRVWVGSGSLGELHRGGTLTLVKAGKAATTDPAFNFDSAYPFTRLAYDTLVTFPAAAGPTGLHLLPDLAVALPRPTNGGRT